jgi:hypothetical protein
MRKESIFAARPWVRRRQNVHDVAGIPKGATAVARGKLRAARPFGVSTSPLADIKIASSTETARFIGNELLFGHNPIDAAHCAVGLIGFKGASALGHQKIHPAGKKSERKLPAPAPIDLAARREVVH